MIRRKLQPLLCMIGIHAWSRSRRGNTFYCTRYYFGGCGKERAWRPSDR